MDYLITADKDTKIISEAAIKAGLDKSKVYHLDDKKGARQILNVLLNKNSVVLFKISMLDQSFVEIMNEFIVH